MISIDGSLGEGGGQILRTALSLSMVTGTPVRIERIRAGRPRPGLMRQHLTAVRAAQQVCGAQVTGGTLGSMELQFVPGPVSSGDFTFSIGTAGSTSLVLQTILPALMTASGESTVTLEGGTHNMYAPSIDFLNRSFLPLLARMGPIVEVELLRHGFYPAGGGRVHASITPSLQLEPIHLVDRGEIVRRCAVATVANLRGSIAQRELAVVAEKLGWENDSLKLDQITQARGHGNILSIEITSDHLTEIFTGFGQRGVSAEQVAQGVVDDVRHYLEAGVPVWKHLADQLMLPLALAGSGSFRTGPLSSHAHTNAEVITRFLPVRIESTPVGSQDTLVTIVPQ